MSFSWMKLIRRWSLHLLALIFVASLATWFLTRDTVPRIIRVATGQQGGLYSHYADVLSQELTARRRFTRREITSGSGENAGRLRAGQADLGVVQAGAVPLDGVSVIAPLAREVVHVIVRKDAGINSLADLRGKRVSLGLPGSGMRSSALQILRHYQLPADEISQCDCHFTDLLSDQMLDAAIVTTGVENPQLVQLLATRKFRLLPIPGAAALELKHPHFRRFEIPQGMYAEAPAIPDAGLLTVATTAYLACRPDCSDALVTEVLSVLYESNLQEKLPGLIPRHEVLDSTTLRWHPIARAYFDPFDQLGFTANLMESLAAIKELLVALGAAIFLAWGRWRRAQNAANEAVMLKLKDRLDQFLTQTIEIERQMLSTSNASEIQRLLDDVSRVKLHALQELTHEDLRGDRMFSIFLLQCGNLSQALQGKLWLATGVGPLHGTAPCAKSDESSIVDTSPPNGSGN